MSARYNTIISTFLVIFFTQFTKTKQPSIHLLIYIFICTFNIQLAIYTQTQVLVSSDNINDSSSNFEGYTFGFAFLWLDTDQDTIVFWRLSVMRFFIHQLNTESMSSCNLLFTVSMLLLEVQKTKSSAYMINLQLFICEAMSLT